MKLIAFDIDGTTINDMRRVSGDTLLTLKTLKDRGYILVPTTGRSLDAIPRAIMDLGICDYAITSNGACITNLSNGETIGTQLMPVSVSLGVLEVVSKYRIAVSIHVDNQAYDNSLPQRIFRKVTFHQDFIDNAVIHDLYDYVEKGALELEKIQLFSVSHKKLLAIKKELDTLEGIAYPMSSKRYFEITAKGAEKGIALQRLCEYLSIALDDVCAIGDDSNDISMLRVAGLSIAMGNAKADVRNEADYVTDTNNRNGFAKAMVMRVLNP